MYPRVFRFLPMLLLVLLSSLAGCGGGGGAGTPGGATTYGVVYDGNGNTGGSVPTDATRYTQGQTVTVIGNTGALQKTGFSFAGWNTQADGLGTTYAQAQSFAMGSADVTLYARWTTNPTYAVTYQGNGSTGGSVPTDSTRYEEAQTVTVLGNTGGLTRAGFAFIGWNTQADGGGNTYAPAQTFAMKTTDVTLYAVWSASPTYSVAYDGNGNTGGSAPADSLSYEPGQTVTVLGNSGNLVKSGYSFAGWNTKADATGTTYTQAQTFAMGSANVTLYARWTANPTYAVTYSGNGNTGGTVPTDASRYEAGQTVTVLGNDGGLTKGGYSFAGWNTKADGTGTTYTATQTFALGSTDVTLYALWTANPTYTVTYDGNGSTGGSVPVDSQHYEQNQTVTVSGNSGNLVKTGYTFAGWNTQANGGGINYSQGSTFAMGSANTTLYANWTPATYHVTYSANGGSGAPTDSKAYTQGDSVTVLDNTGVTRVGYVFRGWNTQSNGAGTTYAGGEQFTMGNANVALYAKWTSVASTSTPTITALNPNSGLETAGTPVQITGTGFDSSTRFKIGTTYVPSGSCTRASSTQMNCTLPAATTAGLNDVTAENGPTQVGTLSSGWRYIAVGDFVDYCTVVNSAIGTAVNGPVSVYGQIYEYLVTGTGSANSGIIAELGYGPAGTDPRTTAAGWTYIQATYNTAAGLNDEYQAMIIPSAAGTYSFVYRFSLDSRASYTYCDTDGAGSAGGGFSPANMGSLTVAP